MSYYMQRDRQANREADGKIWRTEKVNFSNEAAKALGKL
jgi:hypothetical protein